MTRHIRVFCYVIRVIMSKDFNLHDMTKCLFHFRIFLKVFFKKKEAYEVIHYKLF